MAEKNGILKDTNGDILYPQTKIDNLLNNDGTYYDMDTPASNTKLGKVKVGKGLYISTGGTISASEGLQPLWRGNGSIVTAIKNAKIPTADFEQFNYVYRVGIYLPDLGYGEVQSIYLSRANNSRYGGLTGNYIYYHIVNNELLEIYQIFVYNGRLGNGDTIVKAYKIDVKTHAVTTIEPQCRVLEYIK